MKFEEFQIGELYENVLQLKDEPFHPLLLLKKDEGDIVLNRPKQLLFFDLLLCKNHWYHNKWGIFDLLKPVEIKDE